MKIYVEPIVVVEGRYDKIKLETLLDATIIPCDGFRIFKDKQLQKMIRSEAKTKGAILLTDSDGAGFKLRAFLHTLLPAAQVYDLYVPDIKGKEKRKAQSGKEGKLGVEGIPSDILRSLFASFSAEKTIEKKEITTAMLSDYGLVGSTDSSQKRRTLLHLLDLPERINRKNLLRILNERFTAASFDEFLQNIK